jgi:hypothetical protein
MGGHRTKAILAVMMEEGVTWGANWGTDEVKSIINPKDKMFVNLHELNTPEWGRDEGPTVQMLHDLREHNQVRQMFKLLDELLGRG